MFPNLCVMEIVANTLVFLGAFVLFFVWLYLMSATERDEFLSSNFVEIGIAGFAIIAIGGVMHGVIWLMQHVQFV